MDNIQLSELITLIKWAIGVNISLLGVLIFYGHKILRFVNRMEFRVDLMWTDYEYKHGYSIDRRAAKDES